MRRGDVVTVAGGSAYTGKPRPAVVIQADKFGNTGSVTLRVFTSNLLEDVAFRVQVEPTDTNGLTVPSQEMADKVGSVPRANVGRIIGRLSPEDMTRVDQALLIFLGLVP